MFRKRSGAPTVIGPGATFEGQLRIRGSLHVDGTIDGEVAVEGHVSVGPEGCVRGELRADRISIAGRVEATVTARGHLHMLPRGVLKGDATYQTLEVDKGGVIEGRAVPAEVEEAPAAELPDAALAGGT